MTGSALTSDVHFRAAYASALNEYLAEPTESLLRAAYELGRQAVSKELNVLDLAVIHQDATLAALAWAPAGNADGFTRAAGDFFLESLSSFEMIQRGFKEARQALLLERRQTELSRRLSSFLADASLSLEASASRHEMLQLVAEQARELVGAECCLVTVAVPGHPRVSEGVSHPADGRRWAALIRWLDLPAVYELLRRRGGAVRMEAEQLSGLGLFGPSADEKKPSVHGWLAVLLTALDGSEMGAIQLFDKPDGAFASDDEAALVHLAQMASAAAERARLYQDRR